MIGAITGDIIGSPYEFNSIKRSDFQLFTPASRFTDDTVLTCAVAKAFMDTLKASEMMGSMPQDIDVKMLISKEMQRFGKAHRDAGYGARFSQWLDSARPRPYNSWGNGAAMRVSSVGWLFSNIDDVMHYAMLSAAVTHDHPEGIKGAQAIASAIFLIRCGNDKETIRRHIARTFGYDLAATCNQIRPNYSFDESCQGSVPQAFAAFFDGTSYEDVVRLAVSLGGDSDTLACMAGSLASAYYGVPANIAETASKLLTQDLRQVLANFEAFRRR